MGEALPAGWGSRGTARGSRVAFPPPPFPGCIFQGLPLALQRLAFFCWGAGVGQSCDFQMPRERGALESEGEELLGRFVPCPRLPRGWGGQGWSRSAAARSASRCSALTARRSRKREAPTLMDALGCSSGSFIFTDPFDTRMGCRKASAQGTTD